ncbi:uncharacterized protein [Chironomus tepperi]|uniref:uncharacterized protein n=1 Tax=Chironomus tepperi TaxID=113505 RepID=UPI00391FC258
MAKLIILTVLLAISSTYAFWSPCPGILAPTFIESDVCYGTACRVEMGQNITAEVGMRFTQVHNRLDNRATVFLFGIGINLPQDPPNDDLCNHLYLNDVLVGCPTVPGVDYIWRIRMTVPSNIPRFNNARVRFEGLENGVSQICSDIIGTVI